jgi:hypothetical protein
MSISRRTFVKATGTLLTFPATLRAGPGADLIQQQRLKMEIQRIGSKASIKGPAEYFTDTVRVDPLFQANAPSLTSGGSVTFEPGSRTAWHTHPLGQVLIVTAGRGWVQRDGSPIEEIHPGAKRLKSLNYPFGFSRTGQF